MLKLIMTMNKKMFKILIKNKKFMKNKKKKVVVKR